MNHVLNVQDVLFVKRNVYYHSFFLLVLNYVRSVEKVIAVIVLNAMNVKYVLINAAKRKMKRKLINYVKSVMNPTVQSRFHVQDVLDVFHKIQIMTHANIVRK